MRRLILFCLFALTVVTGFLNPTWAVQGPPRGKKVVAPSSEEPPQKARYPALAYGLAILIMVIVITIVAFPSRKETWDQRIGNKHGRGSKRIPWD
jgi:hypothetical protein